MFHVKQLKKEQEKEEKRRRKGREGEGLQKEVCSYAVKIRQNIGTTELQPFYSF